MQSRHHDRRSGSATGSEQGSGADNAVANLLRLIQLYLDGALCEDCQQRVSAAICGQLQRIAHAPHVGAATREACFDLQEHWLHPRQGSSRACDGTRHAD